MNYKEEYKSIMERSHALNEGQRERTRLIEEAIRVAQRYQDRELEFEGKLELMEATAETGEVDKALSTFPWLLNYIDEQEKTEGAESTSFRFFSSSPKTRVLWMYKWAVSDLAYYPNISMDRIYAALDDMAKRYKENGYGEKASLEYRLIIARQTGQKEKVRSLFEQLRKDDSRSRMSDCSVCVRDDEAETMIFLGDYEQAIEHAKPILDGKLSCSSRPYATYGMFLPVYIRMGNMDEARTTFERLYEKFKSPKNREKTNSSVVLYFALSNQFDKGVAYFEEYLPTIMDMIEQQTPFRNYLAGWRLFDEMEKAGRQQVNMRLPEAHPLHSQGSEFHVSVIRDWFKNETLSLAEQFNKRNGNDFYAWKIERLFSLPKVE